MARKKAEDGRGLSDATRDLINVSSHLGFLAFWLIELNSRTIFNKFLFIVYVEAVCTLDYETAQRDSEIKAWTQKFARHKPESERSPLVNWIELSFRINLFQGQRRGMCCAWVEIYGNFYYSKPIIEAMLTNE